MNADIREALLGSGLPKTEPKERGLRSTTIASRPRARRSPILSPWRWRSRCVGSRRMRPCGATAPGLLPVRRCDLECRARVERWRATAGRTGPTGGAWAPASVHQRCRDHRLAAPADRRPGCRCGSPGTVRPAWRRRRHLTAHRPFGRTRTRGKSPDRGPVDRANGRVLTSPGVRAALPASSTAPSASRPCPRSWAAPRSWSASQPPPVARGPGVFHPPSPAPGDPARQRRRSAAPTGPGVEWVDRWTTPLRMTPNDRPGGPPVKSRTVSTPAQM